MKPHPHAELIKAWADGATIQVKYTDDPQYWVDKDNPTWHPNDQYRIKMFLWDIAGLIRKAPWRQKWERHGSMLEELRCLNERK
jgi:hypothetical protein